MSEETEPKQDQPPVPSLQEIKEQLEIDKLKYEITILQKQTREGPKPSFLERVTQYLKKNVGQISALVIFIGGVAGPVFNFLEIQRKNQLIQVNSEVLKIFEKDSLTEASIVTVSIQDPETVVPFLLNCLNHYNSESSKVKPKEIITIYKRIYELNTEIEHYTWSEKVSSFFGFGKSNEKILKKVLFYNAKKTFEEISDKPDDDQLKIIIAYLRLIFETGNGKDKDFIELVDTFKEKKCSLEEYKIICAYIERQKR